MIAAPSEAAPQAHFAPLTVAVPEDPAVRVVFTGRSGGGGAEANLSRIVGGGDVTAARRAAVAMVGTTLENTVFMAQVHGPDVARVDPRHAGAGAFDHADAVAGVDGLVTSETDLALAVMVADCVPVILVAPGHAVAAVHAGRRGVEKGVVAAAVAEVAGSHPARVVAVIGPAIGGCCYEVPRQMVDAVAASWPQAAATTAWGIPSLDLPAAVSAQLRAVGVAKIRRVGGCTRCTSDRFFSHRATTAAGAPAGRQAGIVVRHSDGHSGAAPAKDAATTSLESPDSP